MSQPTGRNLRLSLPRRFICDLVHFAHKVPSVPVERRLHLAEVVAARQAAQPRPSWCTLFTKALALVAAARPELRRAYLSFPVPHLYEHPINIASIAIERRVGDEDGVFFAHCAIQINWGCPTWTQSCGVSRNNRSNGSALSDGYCSSAGCRCPCDGWCGGSASTVGAGNAHYFGTYGVSVYSGLGAASLHPLSPLTTTLNYGVIAADGTVDVRLVYDHRVLDGATVARALEDLEQVLNGAILNELRYFRAIDVA